jgi:hypothetical protein
LHDGRIQSGRRMTWGSDPFVSCHMRKTDFSDKNNQLAKGYRRRRAGFTAFARIKEAF